jgi:hypothetical protein
MITIRPPHEEGLANTLEPKDIGTHLDGWTVKGEIKEDYYEWVNKFAARHHTFGYVWGDFEDVVYADSIEGYQDFIEHHPPHEWDYHDI